MRLLIVAGGEQRVLGLSGFSGCDVLSIFEGKASDEYCMGQVTESSFDSFLR
jgi:hypothetical protein